MTDLNKPVRRKSNESTHRGRRIIVTLYPKGIIGLREERTRKEFALPIGKVYALAVRAEVERARYEKAKARKARKEAKR